MYVYELMCVGCAGAHRGQEALGPLELDLGAKGSGELRPVLHQSRMRSEHSNLQNHHHIP